MKIGFIGSANTSIQCRPDKTFRLASYSRERVLQIVELNLECILKTIEFGARNHLLFYRIADFIPFISHPISIPWTEIGTTHSDLFKRIGSKIKTESIRISMHPGQYIILNSPREDVIEKSIRELHPNVWILDQLKLNSTAKVQVHVGGIYGNKEKAIERFVHTFHELPEAISKRLVIENDDRLFDFKDCLEVNKAINIPIVFDVFHHSIKHNNESLVDSFNILQDIWKPHDGTPMVDWSYQEPNAQPGKHATSINISHFKDFIHEIEGFNVDIMLEIRDKEQSALKAVNWLREIGRI